MEKLNFDEKFSNFTKYIEGLINKYSNLQSLKLIQHIQNYDRTKIKCMMKYTLPLFATDITNRTLPSEVQDDAETFLTFLEVKETLTEEEMEKIWLYIECFMYICMCTKT